MSRIVDVKGNEILPGRYVAYAHHGEVRTGWVREITFEPERKPHQQYKVVVRQSNGEEDVIRAASKKFLVLRWSD